MICSIISSAPPKMEATLPSRYSFEAGFSKVKPIPPRGGMGFTFENPASKLYRDGRVASILGGADEIMLQIIFKKMSIK